VDSDVRTRKEIKEKDYNNEIKCDKCGSSKVITDAIVFDQGQYSDGILKIGFHKDPSAIIFKGTIWKRIIGQLCCNCGQINLKCNGDLQNIWDEYIAHKNKNN
jgi:hypothetical protein